MYYESVQEMFSRTAAEFASQVAIERGGQRVTYAKLEVESNRLANFLLEDGVAGSSMVALFTDDPIRIITGVLAVLKAGKVFVPLDPTFPEQRLHIMSNQVQPDWYVVEGKYLEKLRHLRGNTHDAGKIVCLDEGDYATYDHCEHPGLKSDPEAPCSIYFTSGSTGKPRAILGRLKGIDHFMRWEIQAVGAGPGTRVSQLTSPSFDGFLKDAFVPLCSGGVVCAPKSRDIILDAETLADWLDVTKVELLHCVPSLFRALLNTRLDGSYFKALKSVVLTGEPLYPADVKRWLDIFGDRVKLWNIYGTTETSLSKFAYEIKPEDVRRPSIPVGKPLDGSQVMLVDPRGELCGIGPVGEIHIRTPYRSHGYYNAPELTREVFIQNPFTNDPNDLLHKTGDYGRLLGDGDLEHLGRRDQQVQIRGVRVELGEIENLLRAHQAVADAAVIDRNDADGTKFLVAYVTMRNGTDSAALRQYLAQQVPETMLPSAFVELDQMPRTLNGKIDRKALPALESIKSEPTNGNGSLTPIEEIVAGIWCEVLRVPAVGRKDNFFGRGGHSLLVMQVLGRVRKYLKVELPVRSLFEASTVEEFSRLIEEQISRGRQSELSVIPRVSRAGELPLSYSQERMWLFEQLSSGTSVFNIPLGVRLKGAFNVAALEQTFAEIIRRHEDLRTSFPSRNGEPFQVIHAPPQVMFPVVDLHGLASVEQESTARSLSGAQLNRPFDLTTGPPIRLTLLRHPDKEYMVLCTLHHIISDGWSKGLLMNEISVLYEAFSQGKPSPLAELGIQYADYAAWHRESLAGPALDQDLAYWKANLAGAPPLLALATDRPRLPVQTFNGATEVFTLSKNLSEKLKTFSHQHGVTLFMTLLAAFQVLLHRYTSQDDLVVGTTVANRERSEVECLIGFFVNMLPLRVDCSANPPFNELLKQVRETTLKAYVHQRLPFEKLVEELQPERNLSYQPLFQVIFSLQNQPTLTELKLAGLTLSFPQSEVMTSQCDLLMDMSEGHDGLAGGLQYNSDLFDQSTAARIVKHFRNLLEGIVTDPTQRLSELPLLTEDEQIQTLVEWNRTHAEYPRGSCVHELIESRVESAADLIAAVFRDEHLSYAELNRRANQIARYLRRAGVKAGDLIGICLDHSFEELAALLGVLKAGAAYLPLAPDQPPPRLSFMLADAGVKLVLTQQSFADARLAGATRLLCLDSEWSLIAKESDSNLNLELPVESIAYVIYTSGSTGEPKGVAVPHRALVNYSCWAKDTYLRGEALTFPLYSSLAFDLTVTSIFVPLLAGSAVVVYRAESNVGLLTAVLQENQTGIMKLTPAHLSLIKTADNRQSGIKRLIVGGEALRTELAGEVYRSFGGVEIYNEYGPTETTVGCMIYKFDPLADNAGNAVVPIGTPIQNTQVYVLDDTLNPAPTGVIGELYVGGAGLARGYLRRPDLTVERFVADPFGVPAARMYRTGDRVRRRPDGNLEFLGRADEQVKIRGFRIELGEIESTLRRHPAVRDAEVMARQDLSD
ncbi:MAG TPA: amino acid adenylation domain-containing protein, partial [Pyrinomonadaceae bacterium]|nr:amino acid adenylation domain-containing protein [Pyrinomonadaceae bacterium]